jgi:hypothetical protein
VSEVEQLKVLDAIVPAIAIEVVDGLARTKGTAQRTRHHRAVLL